MPVCMCAYNYVSNFSCMYYINFVLEYHISLHIKYLSHVMCGFTYSLSN